MCYKLALRAKGILPIPSYRELRATGVRADVELVPNGAIRKEAAKC